MAYKIVLEPDVEDGGDVVHCPALAGCYSQGETKEEATENIAKAGSEVHHQRGRHIILTHTAAPFTRLCRARLRSTAV